MEIDIREPAKSAQERLQRLECWIRQKDGFESACPQPASEDASFRRYFRVSDGRETYIVMDAPPAHEDCEPFIQISAWLNDMSLNAPRVVDANLEEGFLLLTDLGTAQYLGVLTADATRADALYGDALRALATIQREGSRHQDALPKFDRDMLLFELSLFHDWLCERLLGIRLTGEERALWNATCEFSVENVQQQPQVFVHRDYHSRNLMLTGENNPGILDFQDAVEGPYTYDLVSLLKDCYIAWPEARVRQWAMDFFVLLGEPESGSDRFLRHFELTGIQRQLKAAGIFARLKLRDGKGGFVKDIPRTLNYVLEIAPRYQELEFLSRLIRERVLPALQGATA
jgi:aminoglycoside/choline kinase family phosphotransferase